MKMPEEKKLLSSTKELSGKENTQKMNCHSDWKNARIKEINEMGYLCNDDHPCFEEVMEIYRTNAKTLAEFNESILKSKR